MTIKGLVLMFTCYFIYPAIGQTQKLFTTNNGLITFKSEAPFETIRATSREMQGLLDTDRKIFAFKVKMSSFQGFNSALQREHFNENYIESTRFPEASFQGKIIEDFDLTKDGVYTVRAKGSFTVHGVPQERIIKSDITVKGSKINIQSAFTVLLNDHKIPIPKVVKDKLSSEINVQVKCQLEPR